MTLEGSLALAELAEDNLRNLGLHNAQVVAGQFWDGLKKIFGDNKPIDYVFIDGHHNKEATLFYFNSLVPHLSGRALVILDDISWSEGMRSAWNEITRNNMIKITLDLGAMGICIFDDRLQNKVFLRMPLDWAVKDKMFFEDDETVNACRPKEGSW